MQVGEPGPDRRAEQRRERGIGGLDDRRVHAGLRGGGRDLLADEARADDDEAPTPGERGAQRAGVLEGAQRVHAGKPSSSARRRGGLPVAMRNFS